MIKKKKKNSKNRPGTYRNSGISNLLDRNLYSDEPNRAYLLDITEARCKDSKYYLCSVIDCFDGSIKGYSVTDNMESSLCCRSLKIALLRENSKNVIIHSDHRKQSTSKEFQDLVNEFNCIPSMGRTYYCFDNARMESFNASIKKERLNIIETEKLNLAQVKSEIFDYICYYNNRRITLFNDGWPQLIYRDKYFNSELRIRLY